MPRGGVDVAWRSLAPKLAWALLVAGLAGACTTGGGVAPTPTPSPTPTPTPTPTPLTVTLTPVPGAGTVCGDGTVAVGVFRTGIHPATCVNVGPDTMRAFLAFLRSPLPAGATVLSAVLTASRTQSGNPYPPGQQLLVEATPWVATSGGLDASDFLAANLAGTSPLVGATASGTTLVVDVRPLVQAYVNQGVPTVDLRLRLSNEALAPGDYDQFAGVSLQVTYVP